MKAYVVGGAVRDALLGRPAGDRDWVVVGATPQDMLDAGFRPVGRDFPVFLHPQTHEEYALARTERKSAPGYHGFVFHADPTVTLEQDLTRRDLTINAIAQGDDGDLIDPCGGRRDLDARVLRHVSPAFVEDPVRLLRLARLAARLDDFVVAPETRALLAQMVERGEVDALVPERVWQELSRGLMETAPERMFEVLDACGALPKLMPELWAGSTAPAASRLGQDLPEGPLAVRWAALLRSAGLTPAQARQLSDRLRAPREVRELAELTLRLADRLPVPPVGPAAGHPDGEPALQPERRHAGAAGEDPEAARLVDVLDAADAWRRPERFEALLQASAPTVSGPALDRLRQALAAARTLDLAAITAGQPSGPALGLAIRQARVAAVAAARSAR